MKKITGFIVDKRYIVMAIVLLIVIICAFLMQRVEINSDLTKYLADDSKMKIGLDLMSEEFSSADSIQTIRVMFQDLDEEQKSEVLSKLEALAYVDSVDYASESEAYNRENHTLYILNTYYAYGSDEEVSIETALKEEFTSYDMLYHNDDTAIAPFPLWIILLAVVLLMIILLVMCNSWLEPFLFLAAIGAAVVINMGTNLVMGSISNVTSSIAAILQLSLSMDYSIILMNRYRQECAKTDNVREAMKEALVHAFSSITSSSLTTIVGLLALAFMRFKIGFDLGVVLAKGVLISMLSIFTLLPGMILTCDKLIRKTEKKVIHISMDRIAAFSYRLRYVLSFAFIILFIVSYILQGKTETIYTLKTQDPIAEVFPSANMLIAVYDNQDEEKIAEIINTLEEDSNIRQITGYSNTLGKAYTAAQLADMVGEMDKAADLNPALVNVLYYDYYSGEKLPAVTVGEFLSFLSQKVLSEKDFSAYIGEENGETIELAEKFARSDTLTQPLNAGELAEFLGLEVQEIRMALLYHSVLNGSTTDEMSVQEFVDFLVSDVLTNSLFADQFPEEDKKMLLTGKRLIDAVVSGRAYEVSEMSELLSGINNQINDSTMELLYLYYASTMEKDPAWTMTLEELVEYLSEDVLNDPRFEAVITKELRAGAEEMSKQLKEGIAQLKGPQYSRFIVESVYPEESAETTAFFDRLTAMCDRELSGNYYLVGNSAMSYEMHQSFGEEMLFITLLTSIAIFAVVAFAFRSLVIPAVLVLIVQCGVYITVSVAGLQGYSIYYLALIIVECILMGATIDYGILFANYYREKREQSDKRTALLEAYNGSIHTILTSGMILILVTGIIGYTVSEPTIGQICRTISTGALSATILILFVLPGILSAFDRLVVSRRKGN